MNWTPDQQAILKHIANGDRDALGVLADHLADFDHHLAPVFHALHDAALAQKPQKPFVIETGDHTREYRHGRHGYPGLYTYLVFEPTRDPDHTHVGFIAAHGDEYPHPAYPYPTEHFTATVPTDALPSHVHAPHYAAELERGYAAE